MKSKKFTEEELSSFIKQHTEGEFTKLYYVALDFLIRSQTKVLYLCDLEQLMRNMGYSVDRLPLILEE